MQLVDARTYNRAVACLSAETFTACTKPMYHMKGYLMKKITKMIVAGLLLTTAAMSCPNWDSSVSYQQGDIIEYNGVTYVAVRTVAPNTAPNPADNGWFWMVTDETCSESNDLRAASFNVDFNRYGNTNQINMGRTGVTLNHYYPVGGGENTTIGFNSIEMNRALSQDTAKTNLESGTLELYSRTFGATGPVKDSTSISASTIETSGEIALRSASHSLVLESDKGIAINSSFGTVSINDHGIETDKMVKAANVVSGEVNLNQKLAELEARIAELEAAK